ncbi:MAG: 16S rRNA (guanine(527)-N(7))-methyltransferase RsmG [Propionibacteriaceae bacterium]|jgi:16S rRNA (guanine527-N7)-methyltransferase|nr:16S rRNA (guanine(527)-N(7))-methyltransferase RsmG [Propionibacteriaceae bacterium]
MQPEPRFPVAARWTALAGRYAEILATKGIEWGLLGPREGERIWERHLLNSVALAPLVSRETRVVDVGSGAGLPGIPLAIARPDLQVTLLEPLLRRYTFLLDTVGELGLDDQVSVIRGRAEEHREQYRYVVCRAVAPLTRLLHWCLPLLEPGGELLALKGESAVREIAEAAPQLRKAGLVAEVVTLADDATAVRVR